MLTRFVNKCTANEGGCDASELQSLELVLSLALLAMTVRYYGGKL